MSKDNRSVKEAREAVIAANGAIENILQELFDEYGVITKDVGLNIPNHIRKFWTVKVNIQATI